MIKGITFSKKHFGLRNQRPITVYKTYEDGTRRKVGGYDSIRHAVDALHLTRSIVSKRLKSGRPYDGYEFFYRSNDPYVGQMGQPQAEIDEESDLPVISFYKGDDTPLARFKSVTFLHKCIGRSIKTILGWLRGARCSDPDCYYKYERDCTKRELETLERERGKYEQ